MKTRHVAAVLLTLGLGAWWISGSGPSDDARYLFDRPWVSAVPEDPREAFHALFLSKKAKAGITLVGSRYQHLISAVGWDLKKDRLQLNFLQQEFKIAGKVKTFKCRAPGELDLCLEVNYRWKKVRLYSSSKWNRGKNVPAYLRFDPGRLDGTDAACPGCREGRPSWLKSLD